MTGWRLLLTRPAAENQALAATLQARGMHSASLPLMEIEALAETEQQRARALDLASYQAVVVVSKPAARLGLDLFARHWPQLPAHLRWFSVGAGTAQVLQVQGLLVSFPAQGDDSEALLGLPSLQGLFDGPPPRVLILRGEGGRELLAQTLRERGASVDYLELYRRVLPSHTAGTLRRVLHMERLNAVLVSSAQGLEHLCQLAAADWAQIAELPLLVPSPRVAELARAAGARHVIDCRGASAAAVLAALETHPAPTL
ncbi:uroporphyrinogen-III synthase [Pseudomonas sp. PDM14]|uniref:uroporphyrinogen-III synthase n=1 Tax=Pseudomonas sp. PDM14 TaxID=2769288 RepID=UPI001781D151|nr:uroporphyrinogen-III synthase [Pseudomonas sp. PDM14]MBD9483068.1 uroporphyrinogen-III synthase [Pseudomonas sp. PDM14]